MFPTFPLDFSSVVDPSSQFQTLCLGMEDKFVTSPESREIIRYLWWTSDVIHYSTKRLPPV